MADPAERTVQTDHHSINKDATSWLIALFDRPEWVWRRLSGAFSGCVVDGPRKRILVAAFATNDLAEVDYSSGRSRLTPKFYMSLPNVKRAGSVAIGAKGAKLWIADVDDSKIVRIDLATRVVDSTIRIDGDIRAVAVDRDERVFVADSAGRQVWLVEGDRAPRTYARLAEFREPSGVAVDSMGRVWVCDRQASAVIRLSKDGQRAEVVTPW